MEARNCTFFSLQTEGEEAAAAELRAGSLRNLGSQFSNFLDTARALSQLDLVISVDTAVAHLAGAIGIPVWILLPQAPDWRWLLHRSDSPWYTSVRLFRQNKPADWTPVIDEIILELARLSSASGATETSLA